MTLINNKESETAKEIANIGMLKAAESLSFFMKEDIKLDDMQCCFDPPCNSDMFSDKEGANVHVLITKIIGEMKGICCLIFSEQEANQLRNAALPPEITNDPEMMKEMKDGILLEVDNIISASVITQFSNILKIKIHGGVPMIKKMDESELNHYIKGLLENNLYIINFKTRFVSSNLDFSPQFLWFFDESFADRIKILSLGKTINFYG